MSLTLSCELVEVFAMACAVLLQNRAQIRLYVSMNPAFSVAPYGIFSLWRPFAMADYNHSYFYFFTVSTFYDKNTPDASVSLRPLSLLFLADS